MMGDPFLEVVAKPLGFYRYSLRWLHYRWDDKSVLSYSKRDKTGQFVRREEGGFDAFKPDKSAYNHVYKSPKSFGKINVADFDPKHFKNVGC